jgi:hypothetical protein
MRRTVPCLALLALVALGASGCESTQSKSARLARQASRADAEAGLELGRRNPEVRVTRTELVSDRNGTAAAVELKSSANRVEVGVPVAIAVKDAAGKPVFSNTGPGLAPSLNHVPALRPGQRLWWVNDQVGIGGDPGARRLGARVGTSEVRPPARLPRLELGRLRMGTDPDGLYTRGTVRNRSKVDQLQLIMFGVARRRGKVVAAGRAGIERLKAGRTGKFKVFWIGDPRGAAVEVAAPPSTLR